MASKKRSDEPVKEEPPNNLSFTTITGLSVEEEYHLMKSLNQALSYLLDHNDEQEALLEAFTIVCNSLACDGAFLFQYLSIKEETIHTNIKFSIREINGTWQALPPQHIDFPIERTDVQDRIDRLIHQGAVIIARRKDNPEGLKKVLTDLDIESYLSLRILMNGQLWGGISFVSRDANKKWIPETSQILYPFFNSMVNFLVRKEGEDTLRAQRDYFRQVIDSAPNPIYAINAEGIFTLVNHAFAKEFDTVPENMIGKSIFEFAQSEEIAKLIMQENLKILANGEFLLNVFREVQNPKGENRFWRFSKVLINEQNKQASEVLTTVADITLLRLTEQQLTEEKHLSESITSTIPDWILLVDTKNRRFNYSNIRYPILGFEAHEISNLFEFLVERLHPEDRAVAKVFMERLEKAAPEELVDRHFRLQHKNGNWIHLYERAKVFRKYSDGSTHEYLAVVQNITENIKAQQELEGSEQKYRNFIEHSFDGIYYMKFEKPIPIDISIEEQVEMYYKYGFIEECNASFARTYGMDSTEGLVGLRVIDVHGGEHFEYNKKSTYDFISNRYQVINSETLELDGEGNQLHILNHAIGDVRDGLCYGVWGTQQDITERRMAEKALKENQNLLEAVLKAIPDLKYKLTKDGIYTGFFESGYETLAPLVPASRFMWKKMEDVLPPDLVEAHGDLLRKAIEEKKIQTQEYTITSETGEVQYRETRVSPINEEEAIAVVRDVTNRKKAEQDLLENRRILKAIVNALPDLKFRVSKDGEYIDYYKSEYENMAFSIPYPDFIGKKIREVLPAYIADAADENIAKAIKTKRIASFEYTLVYDDGIRYVEARVSPMSEDEVIITVRDISDKVQYQQALQEKLNELDEKNKQLTEYIKSNSELENFAYIASHDLREPIRTMHSFAQLLKRHYQEQLDEKGKNYLDFVIYGSENMNKLIEDLLTYSRINTEEMIFESLDLEQLLQDTMKSLTTAIREKNAQITIGAMPSAFNGNRTRMKQLFQNLITNAVKFHQEGKPPSIEISGIDHGEYWLFEVKDDGIGIPVEMEEKIFQLFKKIHYTKEHIGTGIGLALCKRIVDQHGGEIWVESTPGKGSSFYFTIKKEPV